MKPLDQLAMEMIAYESGCAHRIQHFLKVHAFAALIARAEQLDERTLLVLEAAAYTHDIGIRPALAQYGSDQGPLQERLGPPLAREMLTRLGFDQELVERVAFLIAHHHTYDCIEGLDYRILVEADFLVNLHENGSNPDAVKAAEEKVFRTAAARKLLHTQFDY